MYNLLDNNRLNTVVGNWESLPKTREEQFGQLTLPDVTYVFGKKTDILTRIGIRLNKSCFEIINILKKLTPLK